MDARMFVKAVFVCVLTSCQSTAIGSQHQEFIGYRAQNSMLTEVYEMDLTWSTGGGPEILGPGRFRHEFAGPIDSCADAQYYCFSSTLRLAVPRTGTASSWTAGGHACRVLDSPILSPDRPVRILCRTNEQYSVEFTFERRRGILSYRRQCPGCFAGEYVLATETGLFASPGVH
jgi:hypothetical protein